MSEILPSWDRSDPRPPSALIQGAFGNYEREYHRDIYSEEFYFFKNQFVQKCDEE